jgi:threonine synthase
VLTDFIKQGCYDARRPFYQTASPSMDILISSNLERLLYHLTQGDTARVKNWMDELKQTGHYQVSVDVMEKIQQCFYAGWIDDAQTSKTIHQAYHQQNYVLDPHTAVAWQIAANYRQESGDSRPCIILSTASPFKFSDSVLSALTSAITPVDLSAFDLLQQLSNITDWKIPAGLVSLKNLPIRHEQNCTPKEMQHMVAQILGQSN